MPEEKIQLAGNQFIMTGQTSTVAAEATGRQNLRRKAALLSVLVGIVMFALKGGTFLLTNSTAILSDALESVVHVIATCIAFYSIILASRPPDRRHPYGYGKAEYFSAGLEGALIVLAAVVICYEAIHDMIDGNRLRELDLGVIAMSVAGAVNLVLGLYLIRVGRRTNSLALVADGRHVLTDSYTSIGVLAGLILVKLTGIALLDSLVAIGVALNIIITGYRLVAESVRGLMNAADPELLERTMNVLERARTPDMIAIHRLRAWGAGERRFIDFRMVLPCSTDLHAVCTVREHVQEAISHELGEQTEVMIHFDPCRGEYCASCPKADCSMRENPHTVLHSYTFAIASQEAVH